MTQKKLNNKEKKRKQKTLDKIIETILIMNEEDKIGPNFSQAAISHWVAQWLNFFEVNPSNDGHFMSTEFLHNNYRVLSLYPTSDKFNIWYCKYVDKPQKQEVKDRKKKDWTKGNNEFKIVREYRRAIEEIVKNELCENYKPYYPLQEKEMEAESKEKNSDTGFIRWLNLIYAEDGILPIVVKKPNW